MTGGEHIAGNGLERLTTGDVARWSFAFVLVLAGGAAGWWMTRDWAPESVGPGEPAPVILLDLVPAPPVETAEPLVPERLAALEPPSVPPVESPDPVEPVPVEPETVEPLDPVDTQTIEPVEPVEPEQDVVEPVAEPLVPLEQERVEPVEPAEELLEPMPQVPMPVALPEALQRRRENTPPTQRPQPPPRQAPAPQQQNASPGSQRAAPSISPEQWTSLALQQLDSRKVYPAAARERGEQGAVLIAFSVGAGGRVTAVSVARSSGSTRLDQAALETARRASPLPAPPPALVGRPLTATIRFTLR